MSGVQLENLSKRFGDRVIVKDVSIDIADGEFLVLVGPSGCGKTTTLRMLAGLEEATGGTIKIGDRDVTDLAPRLRNIAMVFQSYALYPHKTVRENMEFALKLAKVPRSEIAERVNAAADVLGLSTMLNDKPKTLSGGQRQRVALGRAIVREPEVFLFDEPLSNLDAKLRNAMRSELVRLHHRLGATMIYVTHDQIEAMTMGDRIVVMSDGVVQQIGKPLEIYDDPSNLFVAGFIGTPSINVIARSPSGFEIGDRAISLPDGHPATSPEAKFIGIRPEHLRMERSSEGGVGVGRVAAVEHLGPETIVEIDTGESGLSVRSSRKEEIGFDDWVSLDPIPEKILAFREDGNRLRG
ncbi:MULTISPECIES: ABC transporter ATP-binding protein [unclassified Hyphomicrobium]|uniref:ABC transporter ATP-binding protein n=1 Tax=unclassified Hyphomicrobium TaxID=2619925 RepID=UPI000213E6C6|nr:MULTISPECIES: ABC transporter ATP-binding protein [unclassified Hyphomicrobium]CCB67134.1 ATP-binding transport protein smoK [Hyphomicrobium sp. MC1]